MGNSHKEHEPSTLEIKVKSISVKTLDKTCEDICNLFHYSRIKGPIPLATKATKFGEMSKAAKVYSRVIQISQSTHDDINAINNLQLAKLVEFSLKVLSNEQ